MVHCIFLESRHCKHYKLGRRYSAGGIGISLDRVIQLLESIFVAVDQGLGGVRRESGLDIATDR